MSVSTSSSPSAPAPAVLPQPEIAVPSRSNRQFLRPLMACGGALVIGGLLFHFIPTPVASQIPAPTAQVTQTPMMLAASSLVEARLSLPKSGGRTLSGQWQLTTDITGKTTAAGEIARWVVQPGTRVNAGDSVVEISSGAASRPAPAAESRQDRAEQEQVNAANGQTALAQKLTLAQGQLAAAQDRVEQAQTKVASARTLVKRLLAGEKIPVPQAASRPTAKRVARLTPEAVQANRKLKQAQDTASEARADAADAQNELDAAQKALVKAQRHAEVTATALTKAETDFKADKVKTDVLQNARADADDAQAALKSAQTRVGVAENASKTAQQQASAAETAVSTARDAARKGAVPQIESPDVKEDNPGNYMTADQAATLVADALKESKAATRQADRIHARVEDYQRQVSRTSQRIEAASEGLQQAQQSVLDSVPRPRFTSAVAPVSGTVTWISRLAREVGVGQTVFGISQGKGGFIRFEDKSGAWKSLRVGQTLSAAMAPTDAAPTPQAPGTASTSSPSPAMPASNAPSDNGKREVAVVPVASLPAAPQATFSVRITRISPATSEGEPAQIDAVRTDGNSSASIVSNVEAQIPPEALPAAPATSGVPTKAQPVVVPISVVLPRDGSSYVAVVTSGGDESKAATLQWRSIEIQRQTAFDVEIKSGLNAGERVVSQPILMLSELKPEEKKGIPVVIDASD